MEKKVVFFFFCVAISICLMAETVRALVGSEPKTNGKRASLRRGSPSSPFTGVYMSSLENRQPERKLEWDADAKRVDMRKRRADEQKLFLA